MNIYIYIAVLLKTAINIVLNVVILNVKQAKFSEQMYVCV